MNAVHEATKKTLGDRLYLLPASASYGFAVIGSFSRAAYTRKTLKRALKQLAHSQIPLRVQALMQKDFAG